MKRNIVIAAVTAAAVVGGGSALAFAGGGGGGASATPTAPASVTVNGSSTGGVDDDRGDDAAKGGGRLTAVQAIDAALKAAPGTVVSVDLDDDDDGDDRRGWEVEVLGRGTTSYTVNVDTSTGRILGTHTADDDADDRGTVRGAAVTAEEAAEAASAKGVVTSVDLDDDGAVSWDVEATDSSGMERDWNVDLKSGAVTADRGEGDDRVEDERSGHDRVQGDDDHDDDD
ncbi:peptidase propeptide and YpeB domain protein [Streptomyces sp. F001]|uniref:PepSY domain-containing protein n=1 Tax=Streptomyces sp. F001 TaxID=1510026 RepID=UPI00101E339B|nr:PepSY domain-containing protein [Streptomyces sp. F001]RZB16610.1 peptidase propeptide and YpeB domain protein [Streptomyces sp. F001]